MKYLNAAAVLPDDLMERLQDFVQGGYLYIPSKKGKHRSWGELSGYREEIDNRNGRIQQAYASGKSIEDIAESFFLSVYAIRKIVYKK